jgi:hypothetical protein
MEVEDYLIFDFLTATLEHYLMDLMPYPPEVFLHEPLLVLIKET